MFKVGDQGVCGTNLELPMRNHAFEEESTSPAVLVGMFKMEICANRKKGNLVINTGKRLE